MLRDLRVLRGFFFFFVTFVATRAAASQDTLVTPVRVGSPDAPTTLTVWAQQDYSHLAALRPIADAFQVVLDDCGTASKWQALRR